MNIKDTLQAVFSLILLFRIRNPGRIDREGRSKNCKQKTGVHGNRTAVDLPAPTRTQLLQEVKKGGIEFSAQTVARVSTRRHRRLNPSRRIIPLVFVITFSFRRSAFALDCASARIVVKIREGKLVKDSERESKLRGAECSPAFGDRLQLRSSYSEIESVAGGSLRSDGFVFSEMLAGLRIPDEQKVERFIRASVSIDSNGLAEYCDGSPLFFRAVLPDPFYTAHFSNMQARGNPWSYE